MRTNRNKYPLRKVVDSKDYKDFLECGHILPLAQDIYSNRYPVRRRCHKCAKDYPKDF